MTKIFNFALKIKGVVERVAHAKSSDPATPPQKKNLERALRDRLVEKQEQNLNNSIFLRFYRVTFRRLSVAH